MEDAVATMIHAQQTPTPWAALTVLRLYGNPRPDVAAPRRAMAEPGLVTVRQGGALCRVPDFVPSPGGRQD